MFLSHLSKTMIVLACASTVAHSQTAPPVKDEKLTNTTEAPIVQYKSSFTDYVPYSEQSIESWHKANARVEQIGGWRAYAKEAHGSHFSSTTQQVGDSSVVTSDTKGNKK